MPPQKLPERDTLVIEPLSEEDRQKAADIYNNMTKDGKSEHRANVMSALHLDKNHWMDVGYKYRKIRQETILIVSLNAGIGYHTVSTLTASYRDDLQRTRKVVQAQAHEQTGKAQIISDADQQWIVVLELHDAAEEEAKNNTVDAQKNQARDATAAALRDAICDGESGALALKTPKKPSSATSYTPASKSTACGPKGSLFAAADGTGGYVCDGESGSESEGFVEAFNSVGMRADSQGLTGPKTVRGIAPPAGERFLESPKFFSFFVTLQKVWANNMKLPHNQLSLLRCLPTGGATLAHWHNCQWQNVWILST